MLKIKEVINKNLRLLVTFVICLTIVLVVPGQTALKPKAVTGIDDVIFAVLVSIASSVCIDIIDSPEGRAAVNDFWLTSPGHIREVVENAAETSYALGYYWGQMKSNAYKEVATALRNYFYQGTDIQTDIAVVHTTTPYLTTHILI